MDNKTSILLSMPPHVRVPDRAHGVIFDLLIALAPAALLAVVGYGVRALFLMLIGAGCAAALSGILFLLSRRGTPGDLLYACASGLLCTMLFGAGCAFWVAAAAGGICAVLVFYGAAQGRRTILHPALAAYILCLMLFPDKTAAYTTQLDGFRGFFSLEPRLILASPAARIAAGEKLPPASLLLGGEAGMIGAANPLALLIGGAYLVLRRIGNLRGPVCAVLALFIPALFFPVGNAPAAYALSQLLSGGFLFGAVFFLFPLSGAPMSRRGQALFGLGYGLLCFLLRRLFSADGAAAALLFLETFSWRIDAAAKARVFNASRFGARVEALLLRGAHTRRESYSAMRRAAAQADAAGRDGQTRQEEAGDAYPELSEEELKYIEEDPIFIEGIPAQETPSAPDETAADEAVMDEVVMDETAPDEPAQAIDPAQEINDEFTQILTQARRPEAPEPSAPDAKAEAPEEDDDGQGI